ncbi:MAG: hypothetical protein A2984_00465 [Omnitrophica WOR_2 bacterium RIFCSPLOWO2_01_FULL_41_12]|nr:MAG: hypothetical protein A2984_00465 [Omnitrophica WOR_2 bacterium RIFCSPLOWO2_01_FULL_41_12]
MKRRIRIQGFLIFLSVISAILLSKFLSPNWKQGAWDEFLDALGITIVLFGLLFRIAARGHKADNSLNGRQMIQDGLYALVRHPMYFGTFLIGSGVVLVLFQWWAFFIFLTVFLTIYIPQVNREEENLFRRFGQEYKDYLRVTPKFFPDLKRLCRINLADYLFFKWPWIKKELPSLIGVIAGIISIEIWEDARSFGYQEVRKEFLELTFIIIFFIAIFIALYEKQDIPRQEQDSRK